MKRIYPVLTVVGLCWLVYLVNNVIFHGQFSHLGIVPRTTSGLIGIGAGPFLHASFKHLMSNTVPLLLLGGIISFRNPATYMIVTVVGGCLTGILTWVFARHGCHIGASGLVFCYFGYLIGHAWFHRNVVDILVAVAVGVLYGGLIWGFSPFQTGVSWEGHAAGMVAGVLLGKLNSTSNAAQSGEAKAIEDGPKRV